jgi:Domain of unknown function (DUF4383)
MTRNPQALQYTYFHQTGKTTDFEGSFMAKFYAGAAGAVLLLVGVIGFLTPSLAGLEFHPAHNVIHLASGALGLLAFSVNGGSRARLFAQVFGVIYTLVAIAGFLGLHDLGGIHLGLGTPYNLIHLLVGLGGLAAGFTGAEAPAAKAAKA